MLISRRLWPTGKECHRRCPMASCFKQIVRLKMTMITQRSGPRIGVINFLEEPLPVRRHPPDAPDSSALSLVVERSPEHRMPVMTVLFESSTSWRELHIAEQLSAMRMRWDGRESVNVSAYVTVKFASIVTKRCLLARSRTGR